MADVADKIVKASSLKSVYDTLLTLIDNVIRRKQDKLTDTDKQAIADLHKDPAVAQVLTEGTEIAKIGDTSLFAPEGGAGITSAMVSTTYVELKVLRDSSSLTPGMQYRITDYKCATIQEDTQAVNHPYDIIVTADDEKTLNHKARAIQHEGDAYFANCQLEKWQVWYDLDLSAKYPWIHKDECYFDEWGYKYYLTGNIETGTDGRTYEECDSDGYTYYLVSEEGTYTMCEGVDGFDDGFEVAHQEEQSADANGVVYRLIDNLGNDVPYDFKNIQFKRYKVNSTDTSLSFYEGYNGTDTSKEYPDGVTLDTEDFKWCYTFDDENGNDTSLDASNYVINNVFAQDNTFHYGLLNNVFFGQYCSDNTFEQDCCSNTFGQNCYNNTFVQRCCINTFGQDCYNNTFGQDCYNNTFGQKCCRNTFGQECYNNTLGQYCYNNTFKQTCYGNTFGNSCRSNTFGQNCNGNAFGESCINNTFGQECYNNTFGQNCYNNTFGQNCRNNTLGQYCYNNTFKQTCYGNTFGNSCRSNTFGQNCNGNAFGESCINNTFLQDCYSNTFGNSCNSNTFGQDCYSNIFGQQCSDNAFGQGCWCNTFGGGCNKNTFGQTCFNNTFAANCYDNTFGQQCNENTFGMNCYRNIFEKYNRYIKLDGSSTACNGRYLKVLAGIYGTSSANPLVIYNASDTCHFNSTSNPAAYGIPEAIVENKINSAVSSEIRYRYISGMSSGQATYLVYYKSTLDGTTWSSTNVIL